MKFDLTQPCPNCPFRTDCQKEWLGKERATEIAQAITDGQATFACHKTTKHDDEGEHVLGNPNEQHCAGAMILLEHLEKPNQMMRIMERIGGYDYTKLNMTAPVFKTVREFIRHHTKTSKKGSKTSTKKAKTDREISRLQDIS